MEHDRIDLDNLDRESYFTMVKWGIKLLREGVLTKEDLDYQVYAKTLREKIAAAAGLHALKQFVKSHAGVDDDEH